MDTNGLTIRDGRDPSPSRKRVCRQDANEDRDGHGGEPPADNVADHVDLLPELVVARPEADAADQERPVQWPRGVRVRVGEACVVLEHGDLQLKELAEEAHLASLSRRLARSQRVLRACARVSYTVTIT